MAMKSRTLDNWRNYFRTSNSDIFDIIEHAIMVAASDCPQEFRLRRDRIGEILFSSRLVRCIGCDSIELSVPGAGDDESEACKGGFDRDGCEFEAGGSKESKVNSDQVETNMKQVSNYSYGEAEALTDEIEEESQIVGEVLRIKEILRNCRDESDSVLLDSLRRLQLMALSVDTLKATEIGKSVNSLRKHGSKQIRYLARTLIELWKDMVDAWVNATAAIAGAEVTPQSVDPSADYEEEGLPSPPLDEGAFFATQTSMELSQFFDGMDDDGNPRNSGEFNKNHGNSTKASMEKQSVPKQKQQIPQGLYPPGREKRDEELKKQEPVMKKHAAVVKPNTPSNPESWPGRPTKVTAGQKVGNDMKFLPRSDKATIQKKPVAAQQDKLKCLDDAARLEAAKRKLHERYQQAENAKRQRTIQVMELHDLPKQGLAPRNSNTRPGNHNRHWANGRR